ncbi:hypothetical protein A2U01_0002782 [Trifolium medium]|uniref:Uncharacterized protein n=1 Tax=Trifolium medium TaxID=97028 RepID=A0A392M3N6_9FABA|nr:hypothetical protein [Trifolium medium]
MFNANLSQFAPPYEAACDSEQHIEFDGGNFEQNDEYVELQQPDVEGAEDIDPTLFYQFDVKITDVMLNTNKATKNFRNKILKYVLTVNQERTFIREVDTKEVWNCAIVTSNQYEHEMYLAEV